MKYLLQTLLCVFMIGTITAQEIEFPEMDKSPMDAITYPRSSAFANYLDADDPDRSPKIKVLYSRPYKNDRVIFGDLLKYGEEWRLGANESSEITFYQNVEIEGVVVPRGTYTMLAEVNADNWIFKLSKQRHTAGTENRDKSKDVASFKVKTSKIKDVREQLTIGFQKINESHLFMIVEWDQTRAVLPINLNAPTMESDDMSPMDLVAYPARSRYQNYLKVDEIEANKPKIRVLYSRPQAKGRKVFGELLPYGEMWRLGANQTTTITFFEPVTIGGTDLRAGTYGVFAKVNKNDWDFIIHKNTQSWGIANHDEADDIVVVKAPAARTSATLESLSVVIEEVNPNKVNIIFGWEDTMAKLPVMMK